MDEDQKNTNMNPGGINLNNDVSTSQQPQASAGGGSVAPLSNASGQIPNVSIDELIKSVPGNDAQQPVENVLSSNEIQQPTLNSNSIGGGYKARPTDLPVVDNTENVKEGKLTDQLSDSEIVLPSAPSPIGERAIAGGVAASVKDSLEDIVPEIGIPKAVQGKPKKNNLASPEGIMGSVKEKEDLVNRNSLRSGIGKRDTQEEENPNVVSGTLNTMDQLLQQAIEKNASDLHLTSGYPVTIRVDGELESMGDVITTSKEVKSLIYSILSDEKKELLEVNKEIDFAHSFEKGNARFRVNAYYSRGELSAAFRLIPSHIKSIEELQLPQIYHRFAQLKQGLILVTGPTGHGKSTTIAAILEDINRTRFSHIVTIEDPIEYVFEGKKSLIDQREMNSDTHSWTVALKSALRQDPDVILVGEMRDYETIASAITLAETGHLVFATLHTNSASQTIDRIIDVFPENQQAQVKTQLSNILEAVIAQRLIALDSGGRRAVSEIMLGIPSIQNLIREGKTHQIDNVIRTSSDVGMITLESSLVKLVREGAISIEKAQQYAVYPEEIVRFMKK